MVVKMVQFTWTLDSCCPKGDTGGGYGGDGGDGGNGGGAHGGGGGIGEGGGGIRMGDGGAEGQGGGVEGEGGGRDGGGGEGGGNTGGGGGATASRTLTPCRTVGAATSATGTPRDVERAAAPPDARLFIRSSGLAVVVLLLLPGVLDAPVPLLPAAGRGIVRVTATSMLELNLRTLTALVT